MKTQEIFRKYLGQIMNTKGLLVILLIGVALLVLAGLPGKNGKKQEPVKTGESMADREQYTRELETRLSKSLSTIRGAGSVSVMITLEDTGQSIYAQNEKAESKTAAEGAEPSAVRSSDGSYVLKSDSGGGQSPLLIKSNLPKVSGVLVTAQGAGDAEVKNNLVSAVRAVLDVKAHRVQVLSK